MICSILWRCFVALFLLFNQVWGLCTEQNVQIEGGTYTLSNQLEEGSVLTYQCEEGFYPYPVMSRVCDISGVWAPPPIRSKCIQVKCPDPAVLENCNVLPIKSRYSYQNQITYECHKGYKLYGPSHRTCLSSGKWSGSHPVCRNDSAVGCPDPGVPAGGLRSLSSVDVGGKVAYWCLDTILIGSEERECREDGSWSGIEPTCYNQYTYDSPLEVAQEFGGALKNCFSHLGTTFKQNERKIVLAQNGTLNVYIAVDVSSISQQQFENAKKVLMTLIEKFASLPVTPNYELIFFSSEPIEVVDILSFSDDNRKPLVELIKSSKIDPIEKRTQAGTDLNAVFTKFLEKMSVTKLMQANFEEHRHVVILFTDGMYNMGGSPTRTVEQIKSVVLMDQPKQREEHLDIFIFGIGTQINDYSLNSLTAGTGYKHYFRLKDYEHLPEAFDGMTIEEDIGVCGLHRDDEDMSDLQARRKKYPWAVSVSVLTMGRTSRCLGSLVSPRFVLTAAHCFTVDDLTESIKVEVTRGQLLDVQRLHIHPQYNVAAKLHEGVREFYDYDVALIELTKDVNLSVSLIPICLPCTQQTNSALRQTLTCQQQEQLLIRNYERIKFLTKNLGEKDALVKLGENRLECIHKALTAPGITTSDVSMVVTKNFLCSGGRTPQVDKVACKGDGGGAVFRNHQRRTIQVGVVSWGNKLVAACEDGGTADSDDDSRDFHINLFKVVPFLKAVLGKTDQSYAPLVFVD